MDAGDAYLFVGLRGRLTLHRWAQAAQEGGLDAEGLIVNRSAMLGLADYFGRPHGGEHWGPADCGGDWSQAGGERVLTWMQTIVEHPGFVPIQSSLHVLADVVDLVGAATIAQLDAIVSPGAMADPVARLAAGRDWLALAPIGGERTRVLVAVDAGRSTGTAQRAADIAETVDAIGASILGRVTHEHGEPDGTEDEAGRFLHRSISHNAARLACSTTRWSVDLGAWLIELVAHACRAAGITADVQIAVRRRDP